MKRLVVGPLDTNCYLVDQSDDVIIIDPGDNAKEIIKNVGDKKVLTILVTHNHWDHIGALDELLKIYKVKVNDYDVVHNLEVINTKGHTKDSKTFYFFKDKVMYCGDFLFKDTFGRTDLETGSNSEMINSLDIINKYPDDIILYPGHGKQTTLRNEKMNFDYYKSILKNS